MKHLPSPIPPYGFRNFAWHGPVADRVWTATLFNMERGIAIARVASTGPASDIDITLEPRGDIHWEDFVAHAKAQHGPDPTSAAIAALESLRATRYAERMIEQTSKRKLVYRLVDDAPTAYRTLPSPTTPAAIGWLRLAFGERLETVFSA